MKAFELLIEIQNIYQFGKITTGHKFKDDFIWISSVGNILLEGFTSLVQHRLLLITRRFSRSNNIMPNFAITTVIMIEQSNGSNMDIFFELRRIF